MKRLVVILLVSLLGLSPSLDLSTQHAPYATQAAARSRVKTSAKKRPKPRPRRSPAPVARATTAARATKQPPPDVKVPGCVQIDYKAITVHFSPSLRIPLCVAYELTATQVAMSDAPTAEKRKSYNFGSAPGVPGCPDPGDYRKSGYTRGHMAPAMDMRWDRQAMAECFLMTNICPQEAGLNNGPWRSLEEKVHRWAKRDGLIWVFTGPIVPPGARRIGPEADIAVPRAFYKVLYAPARQRAIAFVYDNTPAKGALKTHATTVARVEQMTGISFFTGLPATTAHTLKQQCDCDEWLDEKTPKR